MKRTVGHLADENGKAGRLHANFLPSGGKTIQLVDSDASGNLILDEVKFAKLETDKRCVAAGRQR